VILFRQRLLSCKFADVFFALAQSLHQPATLGVGIGSPALDLFLRAVTAQAEAGARVNDTDQNAWRDDGLTVRHPPKGGDSSAPEQGRPGKKIALSAP